MTDPTEPAETRLLFRRRSAGPLAIVECVVPAGYRLEDHAHDTLHVCALLSGSTAERRGGGWEICGPGTVRVASPGTTHRIDYGSSVARCAVVHLSEGEFGLESHRRRPARHHHGTRLSPAFETLLARAFSPDPANWLEADSLGYELLARTGRVQRRLGTSDRPDWLRRVRERLEPAAGSAPSLAELSALARRHPCQVTRAFRNHHGMTLGEWLQRRRVELALRTMRTADMPLARIAADCGFTDQSHMARLFRRYAGAPPSRFRTRLPPPPAWRHFRADPVQAPPTYPLAS